LHLGIISELPCKSLTQIARAVGLKDGQALHHFLRDAPWEVTQLRSTRLWLIKQLIGDQPIGLCIDETGDVKKGQATDYVAKQYIGHLGKTENGIVSVNAYVLVNGLTYPLLFKIFRACF
jgi:SRSO17 transposase